MIVKIKRYRMVIPQFLFFFYRRHCRLGHLAWSRKQTKRGNRGKSFPYVLTEDHAKITTPSDDLLLTVISWRKATLDMQKVKIQKKAFFMYSPYLYLYVHVVCLIFNLSRLKCVYRFCFHKIRVLLSKFL